MKRTLLCAVSAITLTTGLAQNVYAFEKIHWDWKLSAKTEVKVDVTVNVEIDPKGATIVEVDQDFKGNVDAKANVFGVWNDPKWDHKLTLENDLPSIVNAASALGNVASITSDWSVQANIKQDLYGQYYGIADVDATANVGFVANASVDNSAQAIANAAQIDLTPTSYHDAFLMANIEQYAYADVDANANVFGVYIGGYGGPADGPIVDNSAIAVGNLVNISVESP